MREDQEPEIPRDGAGEGGARINCDVVSFSSRRCRDPFLAMPPSPKMRRTGLGLSMSYDIVVKQHGGKIDVDTEPGVFTEFTITLPRTLEAQGNTGGPH